MGLFFEIWQFFNGPGAILSYLLLFFLGSLALLWLLSLLPWRQ
jgi:hypothetical protein